MTAINLIEVDGPSYSRNMPGLMAQIALVPAGGRLVIRGELIIDQPLIIDRPIDVVCPTRSDFVRPEGLSVGADAVLVRGSLAGFKNVRQRWHIFGGQNTCQNALVLERLDNSTIEVEVHCGASEYAARINGCLSCNITIISSINDQGPYANSAFQAHHVFLGVAVRQNGYDTGTTLIYTNANRLHVSLEGGGEGVTTADMQGQGNNHLSGTIEGLQTAAPLTWNICGNATIQDLHFENNSRESVLRNCVNLSIKNVRNPANAAINLVACRSVAVDNYHGSLKIDETTTGVSLGRVLLDDPDAITIQSTSVEAVAGSASLSSSNVVMNGLGGRSSGENIFHNPFFDVWTNGPLKAPDGVDFREQDTNNSSINARAFQLAPIQRWPGNPHGGMGINVHNKLLEKRAAILKIVPKPFWQKYASLEQERWVSIFLPVLLGSDSDIKIFYRNNVATAGSELCTIRKPNPNLPIEWRLIRSSFRLNVEPQTALGFYLQFELTEEVGQNGLDLWIGGCSICEGIFAPKELCDHGRRAEHIVRSVDYAPGFEGQRACVRKPNPNDSTQSGYIWYMATEVSRELKWVQLNEPTYMPNTTAEVHLTDQLRSLDELVDRTQR